jgi:hypothetical protein
VLRKVVVIQQCRAQSAVPAGGFAGQQRRLDTGWVEVALGAGDRDHARARDQPPTGDDGENQHDIDGKEDAGASHVAVAVQRPEPSRGVLAPEAQRLAVKPHGLVEQGVGFAADGIDGADAPAFGARQSVGGPGKIVPAINANRTTRERCVSVFGFNGDLHHNSIQPGKISRAYAGSRSYPQPPPGRARPL